MAIHGCRSMKLKQICLRTWYHSIRHVSFENQREKLLDRCPSIRHASLNCETLVGKTTGCVMCKKGACWTVSTQSICLPIFYHSISMPADLLPLIPACLLVLCISICHTCVYGVSLSAVFAGVEPHYCPCLLV